MAVALQAYLGKFALGATATDLTVDDGGGPQAVALTTGEYYMRGYASESPDQLVEHITTKLQALGGNFATAACTLDLTTGLIRLDFTGSAANVSVTWDDVLLRDILGWSANLSGAKDYTAPNPARYVWLPSSSLGDHPVDVDELWNFVSGTAGGQSPGGAPHGRAAGDHNQASLRHVQLLKAETLITGSDASGVNGTFQSLFQHVAHEDMAIRFLADRTAYSASDYKTSKWVARDKKSPLGAFRPTWAKPTYGIEHHAIWDCQLFLIEDPNA